MVTSGEYELRYVQEGLEQLESYLLSSHLYQPLGISAPAGKPPYPQLTLGNLLLAERKSLAATIKSSSYEQSKFYSQSIRQIKEKWLTHWKEKSHRELNSRILLWKDFLDTYLDDATNNYDRYKFEVNRRVLITILAEESDKIFNEQKQLINTLDATLRSHFDHGVFIWDDIFSEAFPESIYWFLYGNLQKNIQ